jgi:hypothetical protein
MSLWNISDENAMVHAILSAYLSVFLGLIEAIISISVNISSLSMAIFGFALLAIVDIVGSLLVLRRWQFSSNIEPFISNIQEQKDAVTLGYLMTLLGVFLVISR